MRLLIVLLLLLGCRGADLPAADLSAERIATRGKIMKIDGHTLEIQHERIPKMRTVDGTLEPMESMTMVFSATSAAPIEQIAVGDLVKVEFTTHYRTEAVLRLVSIEKLPAGTTLELPR